MVRNDLTNRGRQEVVFQPFSPIAVQRLRELATESLAGPLSEADLNRFVTGVNTKTREFFSKMYEPYNVVLVNQATNPFVGAVTVNFEDNDTRLGSPLGTNIPQLSTTQPPDFFGDALLLASGLPDFNNQRKSQPVRIFVGVVKGNFASAAGFGGTPVQRTDSLDTRIRDVSVVLGRVAVHEVGHSLGLVSQDDIIEAEADRLGLRQFLPNPPPRLPDLDGCSGGHNCPEFAAANPLVDRFRGGYEIMDPGDRTNLYAQLGLADVSMEPDPTVRIERLPEFCPFNDSYLRIIHPKP
jgi:hypothetical protein